MSETQDSFLYNYYDYMKTIFLYSHVKTYLLDPTRQNYEFFLDSFLLVFSGIFLFAVGFKIGIIFVYFFVCQTFLPFLSFMRLLFKSKFKIDYKSSFINAKNYLFKVFKRFITFNFYLYQSNIFGALMILTYLLFLISSFAFFIINMQQIKMPEKSEYYMYLFYIHFYSFLSQQLLCSCFYACRDMKINVISSISLFILLILITIVGYVITERIENSEGKIDSDIPQNIMNIIYNTIFLLLHGNCLYNLFTYRMEGK